MAKSKYDTPAEKKRLQDRALSLKPNVVGVIATELGWSVSRPNGTLELLVSFKNLDGLLGDEVSEVEVVGEPIVIPLESEEAEPEDKIEETAEEVKEESTAEEPVVEKKKPGRPKKVAAEESAE